jgi:hypothetical protein
MAAASASQIEIPRKVGMGATQCRRHRFGALGHRDQVNVIRHEAVSPKPQMGVLGIDPQQVQIEAIVFRVKEDPLSAVTALGDVVRNILQNNPSDSRHRRDSLATGWIFSKGV